MKSPKLGAIILIIAAICSWFAVMHARVAPKLLNVSYGPTTGIFKQYDADFASNWKQSTASTIGVKQSHGGSLEQAKAILNGLDADTLTLGIALDVVPLAKAGVIRQDWDSEFPNHNVPYTTPIVFVVRKGNPKGIKDWPDLIKPGVHIVTPKAKVCAGGRWNFLAAWGWADLTQGGKGAALRYVSQLYAHAPILDGSWRGSMRTFVDRGQGDVLIAWENEALTILKDHSRDYEIIRPPLTIRSEQPIALVDRNVDKHGTRRAATAYLKGLYSVDGQRVVAENFYRPIYTIGIPAATLANFPKINEFTFEQVFGNWNSAQQEYLVLR